MEKLWRVLPRLYYSTRKFLLIQSHKFGWMKGRFSILDYVYLNDGCIQREIRDEFFTEKQNFLNVYDAAIADWIARHPSWANIIENSTVSREYVESRMGFSWQLYRVSPAAGLESDLAMTESGLHEEIEGLGSTLFSEIALRIRLNKQEKWLHCRW